MEQDQQKRDALKELVARYEEFQEWAEADDLAPGEDVDYDDQMLALMADMYSALKTQAGLSD